MIYFPVYDIYNIYIYFPYDGDYYIFDNFNTSSWFRILARNQAIAMR